jgi:hypothetical protein
MIYIYLSRLPTTQLIGRHLNTQTIEISRGGSDATDLLRQRLIINFSRLPQASIALSKLSLMNPKLSRFTVIPSRVLEVSAATV